MFSDIKNHHKMQTIDNALRAALGQTITLLSSFDDSKINTIPFKGSWTAAQVGDHLLKSVTGLDGLFSTPTEKAARPADANAEALKKMMLDFSIKMESPAFILPDKDEYDKEWLLKSLQKAQEAIVPVILSANLEEMAPLPEGHPLRGNTKLELVHFFTYHTQRHNHQIQKIKETVQ
jgi:hypothetical protein